MLRIALVVLLAGCIAQVQSSINPPATGGGTLTCRQIVEQCDSQCSDPFCVKRCGDQGTAEGAQLHDAVVSCAQRNGCTDEACIRSACGPEADACQGPDPVPSRDGQGPPGETGLEPGGNEPPPAP